MEPNNYQNDKVPHSDLEEECQARNNANEIWERKEIGTLGGVSVTIVLGADSCITIQDSINVQDNILKVIINVKIIFIYKFESKYQ